MKKIFIIILVCCTILGIQNRFQGFYVQAQTVIQTQEIGVGDVIFENKTEGTIAHGFPINELSYTLTKLHLFIAERNIESANYEWDALTTIKKLEELTKTDVIELLNISADKQKELSKYLTTCDNELQKWDTIAAYMKQEMGILKWDMESCLIEKNVSDKSYFDAIDRYDQKIMETSLKESIQHETCATQNRVQYNAKTSIAQKLVFYLWVLQKKYDVLFAKQEILAQNFQVFRDKILPDLIEIDQLLQQYKF